jgi:hypothetical protein
MMEEGKEAIGSMGDDAPLAVLSEQTRPLSHYFRQNFSQVTNPPIDPLREGRVMTLTTRFKNLGNILAQDETQSRVFVLSSPILTNGMFARMMRELRDDVARIDCTFAREPSPLVGEGREGGAGANTSDSGAVTPTPDPAPQGGGGSCRYRPGRGAFCAVGRAAALWALRASWMNSARQPNSSRPRAVWARLMTSS